MSVPHEHPFDEESGGRRIVAAGTRIPVIDLHFDDSDGGQGAGAGPLADGVVSAELARSVSAACENGGFLVVTGHGIPRDVILAMRTHTARLFENSDEVKARVAADADDPLFRGFLTGRVEMVEAFTVNALGHADREHLPTDVDENLTRANKWPTIPGFQEAYDSYVTAVDTLARQIMRIFAVCLELPAGWFDSAFTPHMSSLTANYYPPQPNGPKPGQLRKMAHRDWGALTILHRDENSGGLQVYGQDGQWAEVPDVPDSFIINIGDLMAIWTNGKWRSTVHRVVNPHTAQAHRERYSVAYFFQPNPSAVIAPVKSCVSPSVPAQHEPVRVDAYFASQRRRAFVLQRVMEGRTHKAGQGSDIG